jgi:DNA replication and repair protein RecF
VFRRPLVENSVSAVKLIQISVQSFRNLVDASYSFGDLVNVLVGTNGAGKTSLLEALVIFGNLRSFRTADLRKVVRHGENVFRLSGNIEDGHRTYRLEQIVEVGPPLSRTLRVDGAVVKVEKYLQMAPLFAITSHDRELVTGAPDGRRAFLDRFVFLQRPSYLEELRGYRRALRQRNAALVVGGSEAEIAVWENPLAAAAARVVDARRVGTGKLSELFAEVWKDLSSRGSPAVTIQYRIEPWNEACFGIEKVEESYRRRYNETRTRDRQMGFTVDGPHRHDLSLKTNGRSVRHVLSSGQIKGVAAALRLASLSQVERERNEHLPVIVDDVDAELDGGALTLLVQRLGKERQLFLSSANEQVAEMAGPQGCRMRLDNGACVSWENLKDDRSIHR